MAIPTRIDGASHPGRTLGRRPIVLARLPYVGADVRAESLEPSVVSQEAMSQQERPSLAPPPPSPTVYHLPPEASETATEIAVEPTFESQREESSEHSGSRRRRKRVSKSSESSPRKMIRQSSKPTGLSAVLFSLHTQLAPFAGAIVALALLASAGLLYWMIVSPSQLPSDFHTAGEPGFEASTAELPKFVPALPSFASRNHAAFASETVGVPETMAFEMPKWDSDESVAEVSSAAHQESSATLLQEQDLVVSLEEPVLELPAEQTTADVTEQKVSPTVGPAFPTTNRPTALDFTKLGTGARRL